MAASARVRFMVPTLVLIGVAGALGGCVDQMADLHAAGGDIRRAIARGRLTSPKAATVAIVSLEGAPAAVDTLFRQSFAADAAIREIAITDANSARYLVRGYLAAYPGEQGVEVAYTYDVFDAGQKRRRARVSDTIDVPSQGDDPWAAVTPTVIASVTSRSADDLAVSLGGTPEAQATATASTTTPDAVSSTPVE